MRVRELIALLAQFDPENTVTVKETEDETTWDVMDVDIDNGEVTVYV